jgi:1,4-dihydroxy-2-naphthoate octaprenyltransferase
MFVTTGIQSSRLLGSMAPSSTVVSRLPLLFGISGSGVGLLLYPAEIGIVCGLAGYFFAKVVQSFVWTGLGDTRH